ncbi:MAG: molybdopterin-binding protein [Campylobacteraceae bacterium]
MKYGARNAITATIGEIKPGAIMCQVDLKDIIADKMCSVMTLESVKDLDLKKGDKVKVLVKAVNVLIVKE